MTQFYSRSDTVFNGDVYSIPFSYTEKNEINVYIDDVLFSDWQFLNDSQIQLTSTPEEVTEESVVSIRRITDISKPIVQYTNNTMLVKEALNSSQNQLLNAVQEVHDSNNVFTENINNTISEVNTAAKLIKTTVETVNEAVEKCTNQANSAESSANTATEKLDEIVQKADEISSSADEAIATIKSDSEEQLNKIKQVGFYRKGKHLYYKDDEGNEVEFKSYSFVPGTIYQLTGKIDESENLFRYANGQVVIEDDSIKGLTAFLDKQEELGNTSIFCTEEEWQAEKTLSKLGQCGKYVRDKEAGTLRLPAIVNLQGVMDLTNVLCVNSGTAEEPERPINNYMVNNPFSFGVSQYYKGEMNNLSWLRSNGQKNYEAVYPDFYNWALGQLNASVEGFKNHTDENITDYDFVINQTDESFILPLKNGMEGVFASGTVLSGYNLYFFVGETMQNSNLANLSRLEETLVDKVDTDLNNMNPSQTVKKTFLSWELPDYSAGVATLTAPCEGWFNVNTIVVPNGSMYATNINGVNVETYSAPSGAVRVTGSMYRVSEGDVIVSTGNVQFFPCKGVSNV